MVPKLVKHFFHSLTHLLKTLQKDGIWHFISLSFILVQNEFDPMPDYCGKKTKRKEYSLSRHKALLKLGKWLYLKVMPFCFTVELVPSFSSPSCLLFLSRF